MSSRYVFPLTAERFQVEALERSRAVPVLLDFWAEWCGPCRTLRPVLEKVAEDYGGAFLVGTVDTEAERDLGYAFQVQSIPFLVLLVDGKPVDAASGALPESDLRALLQRHGIQPMDSETGGDDASPEVSPAAHALARARASATAGDAAAARLALAEIPEEDELAAEKSLLEEGLGFLDSGTPDGAAGPIVQEARECLLRGQWERGLELLLEAASLDRQVAAEPARRGLLLCQALHGAAADAIPGFRRRLATLLY